ncbi:CRE-INS-21 protein [Caenorhabditis remanei]|uniref:CRE-INS-21 protein n=2 Tax=Caenorhabditis remanei TaxID=31234 RepID=E3LS17_CAERE|nr:CRE-INS-21 protein [Caenorhabditis remanei]
MRVFIIFLIILSIFSISPIQSHSTKHVRSLCKRKAVKHIRKICPDMCLTGDMLNVYEYCSMGYSDSQVKFICCPD